MIRIYGNVVPSVVDGPGERAVIHFAGCEIGCPGCFNPHTHAVRGPNVQEVWPGEFAREILRVSKSVTISGGEPTDQLSGLFSLVAYLREYGCKDIVMFTGRKIEWLRRIDMWNALERNKLVDVVVDGPYVAKLDEPNPVMRGSSNQRVICLTDRWTEDDFKMRETQLEIIDGRVVVTGFPDEDLRDMLSSLGSGLL